MKRRWNSPRIAAWILGAVMAGVLLPASAASADVTLDPPTAPQGGFAGLTFRVPNESGTAAMTKVEVRLPEDTPIAEVYPYSVPDWAPQLTTVEVTPPTPASPGQRVQVVSAITWTAAPGKATKPGGVAELAMSLWPLPAKDRFAFTVVQTYSDGTVVSSRETLATAGSPPAHPAPVLRLVPAGPQQDPGAGAAAGQEGGAVAADGNAVVIALSAGGTGLLLGLLIGYSLAWRRRGGATVTGPSTGGENGVS